MNPKEEVEEIIENKNKRIDEIYEEIGVLDIQKTYDEIHEIIEESKSKKQELEEKLYMAIWICFGRENGVNICSNYIIKNGNLMTSCKDSIEIGLESFVLQPGKEKKMKINCKEEYLEKMDGIISNIDMVKNEVFEFFEGRDENPLDSVKIDEKRKVSSNLKNDSIIFYTDKNNIGFEQKEIPIRTYRDDQVLMIVDYIDYIKELVEKIKDRAENLLNQLEDFIEFLDKEFSEELVANEI